MYTARSLRSDRALIEAWSLRSNRARTRLGRYVVTELSPKLGCYVATEQVHGSFPTERPSSHRSSFAT
ncbi:hypothetical protein F2Q68_00029989 [Brassica cretica]|uniref:Uncharacterized protein n=1 Tax=Brassica cretica TaxID=69181 RepID=A0A8S9G7U9_BRACR|nr:hypothetical protein F2Q68_00029989 [Brassica cretica]